jgi:hypothetical protein
MLDGLTPIMAKQQEHERARMRLPNAYSQMPGASAPSGMLGSASVPSMTIASASVPHMQSGSGNIGMGYVPHGMLDPGSPYHLNMNDSPLPAGLNGPSVGVAAYMQQHPVPSASLHGHPHSNHMSSLPQHHGMPSAATAMGYGGSMGLGPRPALSISAPATSSSDIIQPLLMASPFPGSQQFADGTVRWS